MARLRLGIEHHDRRTREISDVPGDDEGDAGDLSASHLHVVLEIGAWQDERRCDDGMVHGEDGEALQTGGNRLSGAFGADELPTDIEDVGEDGRCDAHLEAAGIMCLPQRLRLTEPRFSGQEEVEDDIRIDQRLHNTGRHTHWR